MGGEEERMLGGLLHAAHLTSMDNLPAVVAEHAAVAGFSRTVIYVADLQERFLVPLPGQHDEDGKPLERIRVDFTMAGRAFRDVDIVQSRPAADPSTGEPRESSEKEGTQRLWVPLLDGTERVGVLALDVPVVDEATRRRAGYLASLVALLVVTKRAYSDSYACAVRTEPMSLSAEVLWNLMPTRTFADHRVVVSAALEPAYEVGGDAFDYALNGDVLHLSIFDAMGHDTAAGLTATIAVGSCRQKRREGMDLLATSEMIDEAIADQFATLRFATGLLADLDTRTGRLTWVNRGHHPPLVIRDGRQVITLDSLPSPPMGFRMGLSTGLATYRLEPGDRLLFYTDGVIEARSPGGEQFGMERFIDFVIRREADGLSASETLRRLINVILDHQNGRLQDDATVLMVEWRARRELGLQM